MQDSKIILKGYENHKNQVWSVDFLVLDMDVMDSMACSDPTPAPRGGTTSSQAVETCGTGGTRCFWGAGEQHESWEVYVALDIQH